MMLSIIDHRLLRRSCRPRAGLASHAALAVAREAGARAEEGRRTASSGAHWPTAATADAGLAHLEAAKRIAIEVGDGRELSRLGRACSATR